MYPRSMTNKERQGLQIIKESGLSYEIKFMIFRNEDSYVANVPKLVGTYELKNINPFVRDYQNFIRFQNNQLKLF
jgi:hypothetical protein